jgi:Flp pilus assembly protein TadG
MATNTLFISVEASTGAAKAFGTDTNARDIQFTTTGPVYVVFDEANAGTAATSMGTKPLVLAAGNIITMPGVVMSKAFVRSQTTNATAASLMWYTP